MELKKYKLGEIGEIRMCKRILKSETNPYFGIPFYKIGTFGKIADAFIDPLLYKHYKKSYSFPRKGDVLISAAGTIGKSVIYNGEDAYFQDSNIVWIEHDQSIVLNEFLYYLLNSIQWIPSKGSTIFRLYNDDIRNKEVFLPSIKEQRGIVSVLSSIDRKIELNRTINQNLEAMAKQLYDYWFVQFDFPNEEGMPYKSSGGKMVWSDKLKREIPKGWSVEAIGSILDKYPTTKRYETKEYLSQGKYPIVDQGDAYIVGFTNEDDNLLTRHPAVLFGDHSTKVKLLDFAFARGADGTQILYSNNPNISQYYLYMVVLSLQIPNPGYSRHFKYLKELPIIIPDKRIMDAFTITVSLLFKQRKENIFSYITLSKQRDELLPLLMNGQVSVNSDLSHD